MPSRRLSILLAVLVLAGGLATPARATERADVPDAYKWRTADLYPSEAAWLQARDGIAAALPELAGFQGRLGESAGVFFTALSRRMAVDSAFYRLRVYAMLRKDEDARLGRPSELSRMAEQLAVDYAATLSYLRPEILALGPEKVRGLIAADRRLEPYRPWLEDILRWAPHTGSAAEERIVSRAGIMAGAPSETYDIFKAADMPYPEVTLSSGETVRLDDAAYTQYRALPERADRRKVFQAFWGRHKDFERTLGTTLDAEIKTHLFDKEVHGFGSCLEAALFEANVPTAVYTQLVADVHANLPTLHRYLGLRRRMMGLDTLGYEDLYAPIVRAVDLRYTPEQASELVLAAVAPLGAEYVATLRHGLASGWTDWMPTTGKQSGAYSEAVYGVHPYQLLNFTGLYEEVSTLAHESGHSMHSWLSDRTQPYATREYKTFVAEVASTLNENLLLHYMLGRTTDRDTRLCLLGSRLDDMRQTLFRQVLFGEFELKINEMAERGEPLTGEKLSALYLSLLRDYYGHELGVCRVDELYGVEWAYIQHFYMNFYMYQYATSILGSTSIAATMREEAAPLKDRSPQRKPMTLQRDAYLALLSAGSTKDPITLLREAGVDMTTSAPFAAAMKEMNGIMDEMEKLLAAKR
jgi:oligoendopeptidase F